jgi:hypothetical protein
MSDTTAAKFGHKEPHYVGFIVAFTAMGLVMSGCGNKPNNDLFRQVNAAAESAPAPSVQIESNQSAANLTQANLMVIAMQELMRARRALPFAVARPNFKITLGCIVYQPLGGLGGARYLNGYYTCVSPDKQQDGTATEIDTAGTEQFYTRRNQIEAIANLTVQTKLAGTQTYVANDIENRDLTVTPPPSDQDSQTAVYSVTSTTLHRAYNPSVPPAQLESWTVTESGNWVSPFNGTFQKSGTLQITYHPRPGSSPSDAVIKLSLTAQSDVTFEGACARPMGAFKWTGSNGSQNIAGQFTAAATGINDATTGKQIIAWPNRCLEE